MSKRTVFTTISPLPPGITRDVVVDFLHNHTEMIDLNPLVKERHPISPPAHASPEEFHCVWYALTDKITYLPGGLAAGDVSYTCAFHDLPLGLQTHCYAPLGLDIRDKWTLAGSLPGEPVEPVELGIGAPVTGLYIREDVDMRCNVFMTSFVKKTLKRAHATLVDRLKVKAQIVTAAESNRRLSMSINAGPQAGLHRQSTMGMGLSAQWQAQLAQWQQQQQLQLQQQEQQIAGGARRGSVPTIPPIETSVFASPFAPDTSVASTYHQEHHQHASIAAGTPIDDSIIMPESKYAAEPAKLRQRAQSFYNLRDPHGRISWQALKTPMPSSLLPHGGGDFSPYDAVPSTHPWADILKLPLVAPPYHPAHAYTAPAMVAELDADPRTKQLPPVPGMETRGRPLESKALLGRPIIAELE